MKHIKKGITTTLLSVMLGCLIGFSVNSVVAWENPYQGKCKIDSHNGSAPDADVLAKDGDVVTTNKWNALVCHVGMIMGFLVGDMGNTGNKQSVFSLHSSAVNDTKVAVNGIRLPANLNTNSLDPEVGGIISFHDPSKSYTFDTNSLKGGIYSHMDGAGKSMIGLAVNKGGAVAIRREVGPTEIGFNPDTNTKLFPLAWESISLSSSTVFDSACQYRVRPNGGSWILTMTAQGPGDLMGLFYDSNTTTSTPISIHVKNTNKALYTAMSISGGTISGTVFGDGTIAKIEKFCLPDYTGPGVTP